MWVTGVTRGARIVRSVRIGAPGGVIRQNPLGLQNVDVQAKRYADDNSIGALDIDSFYGALARRDVHAQTGLTTAIGFTRWALDHDVPGHRTVAIRFGTWNDSLRAAGLWEQFGAPRRSFTEEDLWAAVGAVVRALDGGTTARAAEQWLKACPAAPFLALIRRRIDLPWAQITATALEVMRGQSDRDPAWIAAVTADRDWFLKAEQVEDLQHVRDAIAALASSFATSIPPPDDPTSETFAFRREGSNWMGS